MPITLISVKPITQPTYTAEVHKLLYVFDKPKEKKNMPVIRFKQGEALPERSARGVSIPEVNEVLEQLKVKPFQPFAISLTPETKSRLSKTQEGRPAKNPLRSFAGTLKRTFKNEGLPFDAYHNDSKGIVVVVATTAGRK
jgi:hypothetical protein